MRLGERAGLEPAKRMREVFGDAMLDLCRKNDKVVVLDGDLASTTKTHHVRREFPERFFNIGIAESNMIGIAAGLANGGKKPFACGASCFLTGRALEQIKVDIAYSNADVTLCGMSAGVAYGPLGPTHHSIEDLAWLRAIAGLAVVMGGLFVWRKSLVPSMTYHLVHNVVIFQLLRSVSSTWE